MSTGNEEATPSTHPGSVSTESEDDDFQPPSIYAGLSALFGSDKFSDMTIRCGDRQFKAHRAIVCSQSRFFDRALTGGFAEAATGIVDLPEDDPEVLERFLQFLYTGTYTDLANSGSVPPSDACMLSPEEAKDELNRTPGVQAVCPPDQVLDDDPPDDDGEHYPDNAGEEHIENPTEEPQEEYDSFDEGDGEVEIPTLDPSQHFGTVLAAHMLKTGADFDTDEKIRQLHRDSHTQLELEFFLPLRLYIMADKFDVPALRLLARDRFYRAAELSWRVADCFPDVVDELYTNTLPTDLALREIVCRLVGVGIKDEEQRAKMDAVMRKHGDFAVGVMDYMFSSERVIWT